MKSRIRDRRYLVILFLVSFFVFFNATARGEETLYQIKEVSVSEKDDLIEVIIGTTGEPQYKYFQLENPPRLVIDFLNATSELIAKELPIARASIRRVRSGQFSNEPVKIVRVVIDLKESLDYRISARDNQVVAVFSKGTQVSSLPEVAEKESAREIIERVKKNMEERVKKNMEERVKKNMEEEVEGEEETEVGVNYEEIEVEEEAQALAVEEPRISLDIKDADLVDVLRLIAHKAGVNIVPSKNVSGKVTVRLKNVPWEQALDVILKSQDFAYIHEKGLIRVGQRDKFALEEMTTQIIPLRYATAETVQGFLSSYRGTSRGWIGVDTRTNSLIITDTTKKIAEMREIVKELDVKTRQVLIEAKIVEVSKTGLKELGVTWSVDDARDSELYTKTSQPFGGEEGVEYVDDYKRGRVNFGATAGMGGFFTFGFLTGDFNIDMALHALESRGEANILSSPSILAMDDKQATITSGKSIPLLQTRTTPTGTEQTVEYQDVGITLIVTPSITPDNYIFLTVNPRVEDIGEEAVKGYPIIITNSVMTDVLVKDGDTIVIGGIIRDRETTIEQKVPFLGDLPILGRLFRSESSEREEAELLVFIRTKIIRETG